MTKSTKVKKKETSKKKTSKPKAKTSKASFNKKSPEKKLTTREIILAEIPKFKNKTIYPSDIAFKHNLDYQEVESIMDNLVREGILR